MSWFSNLQIGRKLLVSFAALILVIGAINATTYGALSTIQTSNGWTTHTYKVIQTVNVVMAAMVDQETGVRGYLVSGDQAFLEPYRSGQRTYDETLAEVRAPRAKSETARRSNL